MKIKNQLISMMLLCCGLTESVWAESRWWGGGSHTETTFQEVQQALPPVPDVAQEGWFELYISPTYSGSVLILMDSIVTAPDNTIRYVLNRRSANGYDNITAEGLYCFTGNRLLGSDGAQVKIFAYADSHNRRWLLSKQAQWQIIGGKTNRNDSVRGVLYDAFCVDGKAKNDEDLRGRLRREAGRPNRPQYGK